ncbi:MAG: FG-GAP and VCBS repeat-containing protein [Armatimonadota bacterium]
MNTTLRTHIARSAAIAGIAIAGIGLAPRAEAASSIGDIVGNAQGATKGDYNGDGFADLASIAKDGSISVVYGSVNGLSTTASVSAQIWTAGSFGLGAGFNFNRAGTSGDFNGDGYTDLAALGNNEIWVINGSKTGLTCVGAQRYIPSFFFDNYGGNLPYNPILVPTLIAGDFDNDGIADLVVGGEHLSYGLRMATISVVFGNRTRLGMGRARRTLDVPGFSTGDEMSAAPNPYLRFGVGRIDGKAGDDLVIGTPREGLFYGSVRFVSGSTTNGIDFANTRFLDQNSANVADSNEIGDFFGGAIAVGDFNGDGFADVAVGSPGESVVSGTTTISGAGAVHLFKGSSTGIAASTLILQSMGSIAIPDMAVETNDAFGQTLASADFNGDGRADLAIGSPGETVGAVVDAGAVTVVYGGTSGLSATAGPGKQMWHYGSRAVSGDYFGCSLVGLDFGLNGTGTARFADLAIGVRGRDYATIADSGFVQVFYGSANGVGTSGNLPLSQSTAGMPSTATTSARFGTQVF